MNLLDVLFNRRPQVMPYTNKQPLESLEALVPLTRPSFVPVPGGWRNTEDRMAAVNEALARISPAAGQLRSPDRPDGLMNLYNLLKDGTIYRNSW